MSNSAPPLRSKFAHDALFPAAMLDASKVKPLLGVDAEVAADSEGSLFGPLLAWMKEKDLHKDPSYSVQFVHHDFKVVFVTKFEPEDYKGFLEEELPFELLQPIRVTIDD